MARHQTHWSAQITIAGLAVVAALGLIWEPTGQGHTSAGVALLEEAPLRADVLRGAGGTYIGRLLLERDSTLSRWPTRVEDPIRVWIEPIAMHGFNDRV